MRKRAIALLLLVAAIGACGRSRSDEIVVSAAASLTDAFSEIADAFEAANPDVEVLLNFGGSSTLREQILAGAPIDVFASANIANMDQIVAAGMAEGAPTVFIRNRLQIAVPAGNPGAVTGLADFADETLLIGLCAEGVPCGDLARTALADAGIAPAPDTNEPDVRALLTKVEAGELDAALVYATDVASSDLVEGIDIPEMSSEYMIAVLAGAGNHATSFVDFVTSAAGRAVLIEHGFVAP